MKAPNFSYFEPATLVDAIKFKSSDKNSVYLAGGQSLMPALNMRLSTPSCLIDINKLEELKKINIGNDYIEIGALCTHSKLISNIELNKHFPSLPNILRHVAHPAIRNKGTHGGSIAYADPAAELPSLALALDANFVLEGIDGERIVPAKDFFIGLFETEIKEDEILKKVIYPRIKDTETLFFDEIVRRHGDYAMAGLVALLKSENKKLTEMKLVFFGTGDKPNVAEKTSIYLLSNDYNYDEVKSYLKEDIDFTSDVSSSSGMKAHLSAILIKKMLKEFN